ncbi:PAS domain S-box protein [Candidatus Poribacteria bacterium]
MNMGDESKTKKQLIDELTMLRRWNTEPGMPGKIGEHLDIPLDSIPIGVMVIHAGRHVITDANHAATEMVGLPKEQIIGRVCHEFICPREMGKCPITDLGQAMDRSECVFVNAKGNTIPIVKTVTSAILDGHRCLIETFLDISERKQMEDILRGERDKAQKYLDVAAEMLIVLDTEGRVSHINRRGCDILECQEEEIVGKNWFDNFLPETLRQEVKVVFDELMAGNIEPVEHYENSVVTKTGHEKIIAWHNTISVDKSGEITGSTSSGLDITERKRTEEALRKSEEKHRAYIENAPEGIFIADSNGRYVDVNQTACLMTGYSREELLNMSIPDLAPPESPPEAFESFNELKETGKVQTEVILRRKDGTDFHSSLKAVALSDDRLMAFCSDITDRKRTEEALDTQRDLGLSLSAVSDLDDGARLCIEAAIHVSEMDCGGIYLVDETSGDLDMILHRGLPAEFIRSASHYDADSTNARLVMAGKPVYTRHQELRVALDKSEQREALRAIAVVPIHHEDQVIGCLNVASHTLDDVPLFARSALEMTANQIGNSIVRLKAEEAQRESEEKYKSIFDNSMDAIYIHDLNGRFLDANQAALNLLGYTKAEITSVSLTSLIDGGQLTAAFDSVKSLLEGKHSVQEYTLKSKDDERLYVEAVGSVVYGKDGRPVAIQGIARDITERKRIEAELQKMEKLESIGILAGGIAHDLNNFLTAIVGNISLAMMYEDPREKDGRLTEAEKACMQVKDLTQQLLIFSKGGAPILRTAAIGDLLKDSATFTLSRSNVGCEFSIPDDLWSVDIDEGQINQVINNLIINSQQAMPDGGTISISAENTTIGAASGFPLESGAYIKISVEDQGTGISEEHLQRIFDPFFTTKQAGNGLGLATSYSIIEKHKGHIAVESRIGVGTTFHIYLPASPEGVLMQAEEEKNLIMGEGRILVMDDEKHVRDVAASMLSSIGYEAITAIDGVEAIERYKEAASSDSPFDAIIIDLTIPGGVGGKETIQRLMEIDPEVKAIVSSGYSNDPILANFSEYGFRDLIAKPYKTHELSEILHRVIKSGN